MHSIKFFSYPYTWLVLNSTKNKNICNRCICHRKVIIWTISTIFFLFFIQTSKNLIIYIIFFHSLCHFCTDRVVCIQLFRSSGNCIYSDFSSALCSFWSTRKNLVFVNFFNRTKFKVGQGSACSES